MFCQKCGTLNSDQARFCKQCGTEHWGKVSQLPSETPTEVEKQVRLTPLQEAQQFWGYENPPPQLLAQYSGNQYCKHGYRLDSRDLPGAFCWRCTTIGGVQLVVIIVIILIVGSYLFRPAPERRLTEGTVRYLVSQYLIGYEHPDMALQLAAEGVVDRSATNANEWLFSAFYPGTDTIFIMELDDRTGELARPFKYQPPARKR